MTIGISAISPTGTSVKILWGIFIEKVSEETIGPGS